MTRKPTPPFLPYSDPIEPRLGEIYTGWARARAGKKGKNTDQVNAFRATRNWLKWNRPAIPSDVLRVSWPELRSGDMNPAVRWDLGTRKIAEDRFVTLVHLNHKPTEWGDVVAERIYVMKYRDAKGQRYISRSIARNFTNRWLDAYLVEDHIGRHDTIKRRIRRVR